MKPARPSYPRVNCLVPGCKRGTTRMEPREDGTPPEVICGKHWRTVPVAWRRRMTLFRRKATAAEKRGDEAKLMRASMAWWQGWDRIVRLLSNPDSVMAGELPVTIATELEREGLL